MEPDKQVTPKKGYSKLKPWQWVVIYIVVAVIVYGLIYLLFIHKGGTTASGSSSGY